MDQICFRDSKKLLDVTAANSTPMSAWSKPSVKLVGEARAMTEEAKKKGRRSMLV